MNFSLPKDVLTLLQRLNSHGFAAEVVGGPVRDFYLGTVPSDYDITTSATPDQIKSAFADMRTVDTGIKHGTVTVVLHGENYEVTTYRIDGEYKDGRHPETVEFTTRIEEDLSRRDFTVNAMAYSPSEGIIDPFGGISDINARIIRTVGDPDARFTEDALRMLRALRFSSKLGFTISNETRASIRRLWSNLALVSKERICVELTKLFDGANAYSVLNEYSDLLAPLLGLDEIILPDRHRFDGASWYVRLLSVFALSSDASAEDFRNAAISLRTDSRSRDNGTLVLGALGTHNLSDKQDILRMLSRLGEECGRILVSVEILLGKASEDACASLSEIIASGAAYRISDLSIGGREVVSLGARGEAVGAILRKLLELVISEKIVNEPDALILAAGEMIKNRI